MSWPFDTTTPLVTPDDNLDYLCRRSRLNRQHLALPPTLVATFQRAAYERLVEGSAATIPPALQPAVGPGSSGSLSQFLVGRSPGG